MEIISRTAGVFNFLFGMLSFDNEEIDGAILNYDVVNIELGIFGMRVYLNPDMVSQATKIPCKGESFLALGKLPNWKGTNRPIKFVGKLLMFQGMV